MNKFSNTTNFKVNFCFLIIYFLTSSLYSQNFSGKIIYKTKIKLKDNVVGLDSLVNSYEGKTSEYLIMNGFYKSTYLQDENETYSYLYDNKNYRMYDVYPNKDYITYRDSRKSSNEYQPPKIFRDSIEIILGRKCFKVENISTYNNYDNYYSDEIKIDPKYFKGHKVGNWYQKLKQTGGCISMKSITEYDNYYKITEAIEIIPLKLKPADFEIRSGKPIVASPTALDSNVQMIPLNQIQIDTYRRTIQNASKNFAPGEEHTSYISFIVDKEGKVSLIDLLEITNEYFDRKALELFKQCNLKFEAGMIEGTAVSSLVYLPITFQK